MDTRDTAARFDPTFDPDEAARYTMALAERDDWPEPDEPVTIAEPDPDPILQACADAWAELPAMTFDESSDWMAR